jgi:putative transposase
VINRGNARAEVFHKDQDLDAFVGLVEEASIRIPIRIVAYCLMPNHFDLVLWPLADGDVSRWVHCLSTTHVRRYLRHHGAEAGTTQTAQTLGLQYSQRP